SDLRNAVNVLEQCNTDNAAYPVNADVPASGGAIGTSCAGQSLNASSGTAFTYFTVSGSDQSAYIMSSKNSSGSGKTYCYSSAAGGPAKTTGTAVTGYRATC